MVEVELPAPVSGHSPIQICVIRGWNKCIAALLQGYTQKLLSLGYAPEEGASIPLQVDENFVCCRLDNTGKVRKTFLQHLMFLTLLPDSINIDLQHPHI